MCCLIDTVQILTGNEEILAIIVPVQPIQPPLLEIKDAADNEPDVSEVRK
jgi:hypothetical protein